jgi:hypothetical protein
MEEETQDKSLKDILLDMSRKIDQMPEKKKRFKIPFKGKLGKLRIKKGWVTVMKIGSNRNITFTRVPIDEQTAMVDGTPRIMTADEVLFYKNKPLVILPEWSVKPFSPTDNYEEVIKQQYASQGYKLLLNRMKTEAINAKKKFGGPMLWIIILLVVGVGGYLAWKGGYI